MPDEALFCEHCGKERQLVPDYEAEVNESIDETISNIAVDLANTQEIVPQDLARHQMIKEQLNQESFDDGKEEPASSEETEADESEENTQPGNGSVGLKIALIIAIAFLLVFIVGASLFLLAHIDDDSYESQLEQAGMYESQGDYEQMLVAARKASELADNSSAAKIMVAKAYAGLGRTQEEKIVLEGLVITDPAFTDAYTMLIPMYEESGEYEKIAEILLNCPEQSIIDRYSEYIASPPEFSVEAGSYVDAVSVKLLASGSGTIYYTVDGSAPTVESSTYSMPILIDSGKVKIRCIYRNSYGIVSEESSAQYEIKAAETKTILPEVSLPSGSYNQPQIITVTVPEEEEETDRVRDYQIFYTTDGSDPGLESRLYEKPIALPLGNSEYRFALVDMDGNVGESVDVSYQLSMDLTVSVDQARNLLMQALVAGGVLVDAQGDIVGGGGRRNYTVTSVFIQDDGYYYLLEESFEGEDGSVQNTGNIFAVSATTGQSYTASESATGVFSLGSL